MKSKAQLIREHCTDRVVLDVGGTGYGEDNPYEREMTQAWKRAYTRDVLDNTPNAQHVVDLNRLPAAGLPDYDLVVLFDVLEHVENPCAVLRWIPGRRALITVPNSLSWIALRMEYAARMDHLHSFTGYTARCMVEASGWSVEKIEYTFGKWSLKARILNAVGSLAPSLFGTGIVLHCRRVKETS